MDNSCQTRCQGTWLDCLSDCPCNTNCPEGCSNCPNPICNHGLNNLMILNDDWSAYNFGFIINTSSEELERMEVNYNDLSIEDSCAANYRGEIWILGGWINEKLVAKFKDNTLTQQVSVS